MTFRSSVSALIVVSALALVGCQQDPGRAAVQKYLTDAEPIATELSQTGGRFETLMNVQDPTSWNDAQKKELKSIVQSMQKLDGQVKAMQVPGELGGVHPLLIQSMSEMINVMRVVVYVSEHPETAATRMDDKFVAKATRAEDLATQYSQKLDQAIRTKYPDLAPKGQ